MRDWQILFTEPNVAALLEQDVPDTPGEHEVLVQTHYTAVSAGTERANLVGELHINGAQILDKVIFPRALGYSGVGTVLKTGAAVAGIAPGDRVITYFGQHRLYNLLPEERVFPISQASIASAEAALVVIAGFSLEGVRKTKVEVGESALVAGLGILGLLAVELFRAAGAVPVVAADPNPQRRELSLSLGADIALDPLTADYTRAVKAAAGGRGVNAAVEVTGAAEALTQTLGCMARFGRVALLGCTRNTEVPLDFYHLVHFPGVALIGANNDARPRVESAPGNWTARDDCQALLRLLAGGRLNLAPLISEIHSPIEAPEVYRRLAFEYGSFPIGVLFDWTQL